MSSRINPNISNAVGYPAARHKSLAAVCFLEPQWGFYSGRRSLVFPSLKTGYKGALIVCGTTAADRRYKTPILQPGLVQQLLCVYTYGRRRQWRYCGRDNVPRLIAGGSVLSGFLLSELSPLSAHVFRVVLPP
jgi:hypothetical protein